MNRSRTCREKGNSKCATKGAAASRKTMNCLDRNVQKLDNARWLCNHIISQDKAGYVTYSFLKCLFDNVWLICNITDGILLFPYRRQSPQQ